MRYIKLFETFAPADLEEICVLTLIDLLDDGFVYATGKDTDWKYHNSNNKYYVSMCNGKLDDGEEDYNQDDSNFKWEDIAKSIRALADAVESDYVIDLADTKDSNNLFYKVFHGKIDQKNCFISISTIEDLFYVLDKNNPTFQTFQIIMNKK